MSTELHGSHLLEKNLLLRESSIIFSTNKFAVKQLAAKKRSTTYYVHTQEYSMVFCRSWWINTVKNFVAVWRFPAE